MIRRINLFGGACAGKSTSAAEMYSKLKKDKFSVELVREVAKEWVYRGQSIKDFDQVAVFAEQQQRELQPLRAGVKHIITDSPLLLSSVYSQDLQGFPSYVFNVLCEEYEKRWLSLNIFVDRGNKEFNPEGRWGDKNDAVRIDKAIMFELMRNHVPYYFIPYGDAELLYSIITDSLNGRDKLIKESQYFIKDGDMTNG